MLLQSHQKEFVEDVLTGHSRYIYYLIHALTQTEEVTLLAHFVLMECCKTFTYILSNSQ